MSATWSPSRQFPLERVLQTGSLAGLRLGDDDSRIATKLGTPQAGPARMGRRSRLWCWQYGNVLVYTEAHQIVDIQVDFEGEHPRFVVPGKMADWTLADWQKYADCEGWACEERGGVLVWRSSRGCISMDTEGALHLVSLRASR